MDGGPQCEGILEHLRWLWGVYIVRFLLSTSLDLLILADGLDLVPYVGGLSDSKRSPGLDGGRECEPPRWRMDPRRRVQSGLRVRPAIQHVCYCL